MIAADLTPADVAGQWNCGVKYVYEQLASGALVGSFFADRWHIEQAHVDAFVVAHRPKASAAKAGRRRPRRHISRT